MTSYTVLSILAISRSPSPVSAALGSAVLAARRRRTANAFTVACTGSRTAILTGRLTGGLGGVRTGFRTGFRTGVCACVLALSASGVLFSGAAQAEMFGVRVIDNQGKPMAGVAVCVGIQGNYKRFGALFTDSSGTAVLEVPGVPLVVTVSKNRFTGMRIAEPARRFALIKEVRLQEGVPGPRCKAGSSLVSAAGVPVAGMLDMLVRGIDISGTASSRLLRPDVIGEPSHYRIGQSADLGGESWQPYSGEIMLSSALSTQNALYMQLRNRLGGYDAWVESVSDVITIIMPTS